MLLELSLNAKGQNNLASAENLVQTGFGMKSMHVSMHNTCTQRASHGQWVAARL